MTIFRLLAALALMLFALPAAAETVASAASPSGTLTLTVSLNDEGRIGYAVSQSNRPVIGESHLGFLFSDAPQMLRNFQLVGQQRRTVDDSWEQPWGEWRNVRNHFNELSLTFEEKSKLK